MNAARKAQAANDPALATDDAPQDPWLSLHQAQIALGEARSSVLQRVIRKELEADIVAGRTVISKESVRRVLEKRGAAR